MPDGFVPVEGTGWRGRLARPEYPGGEDAVEEGLDEGGSEEGGTALAPELDSESVLQGGADGGERGRVTPAASTRLQVRHGRKRREARRDPLAQRGWRGARGRGRGTRQVRGRPYGRMRGASATETRTTLAESASRKVSSFAGFPCESSPIRTKSRVLVTRTSRYLFQYRLT